MDQAGQTFAHEKVLGNPTWFKEGREITARPQLGDPQLHRAGPRLSAPIAVAVALGEPLTPLLAIARAG